MIIHLLWTVKNLVLQLTVISTISIQCLMTLVQYKSHCAMISKREQSYPSPNLILYNVKAFEYTVYSKLEKWDFIMKLKTSCWCNDKVNGDKWVITSFYNVLYNENGFIKYQFFYKARALALPCLHYLMFILIYVQTCLKSECKCCLLYTSRCV